MKLSPYPKYKPSGIDWLWEVPEHWEVDRLKWTTVGMVNGIWGEEANGIDDLICVRVADFNRESALVVDAPPTLRAVNRGQRRGKLLRRGDLLIEKSGGGEKQLVGCVVYFDHEFEAVCSNFVARMPTAAGHSARYWLYVHAALYAGRLNYPAINQTTGIQNLDSAAYLETKVGYPPFEEQRAIADYLDHETAKIDMLVAKKRTLIERLKEKRTAVISRTVTRGLSPDDARQAGLDPHPKLKPSGIDWLGDVPAHWEVKRLKFILAAPLKYGANEAADLNDPSLPRYVRITDIDENDGLREETFKSLPVEVAAEYLLREGDLLFARSGATAGKTFLYRMSWGACAYAGYLIRARIDKGKAVPEFVRHFTASSCYWQWLSSAFIQATIQNVSAERYASLWVPLPAVKEQVAITNFLDHETAKLDIMARKVETAIERLQEYRTALITAAVTGKIDVHEAAA